MPQQVDARPAAHTLQPEQLWRLGVAVAAAAVFVVMLLAGGGPTQEAVTSLWHLLDVSQLESNPFTSLWFLHRTIRRGTMGRATGRCFARNRGAVARDRWGWAEDIGRPFAPSTGLCTLAYAAGGTSA